MAELAKNSIDIVTIPVEEKLTPPWKEAWQSFCKNRLAVIGLGIVLFFVFLAFIAPWVAPYSYKDQNLIERLQSPSSKHWFGTDDFGRDIFRVSYTEREYLYGLAFSRY